MSAYINMTKIKSKILLVTALSVFMLSNVNSAPQLNVQAPSKINAKYVEGEVLVRFKTNMTMQAQQNIAGSIGGLSAQSVSTKMKISKVTLQQGDDVASAVEALKSHPDIEFAQPNYIYHASVLPNDTSISQLWGMKNTGQTITNPGYATNNPGTTGLDIDAESAWDQITDCRSAIVAVLDTGINYTHQDLVANMWDGSPTYPNHGYDFVSGDNDPMPTAGNEDHGTHVAGTIGAVGNNNSGVAGVCWQATIMAVRVLGANGGNTGGIISGIEFASDNGAKVINMSLGGEGPFDTLFNAAITYAQARDVVVVVAAGNGGDDGVSDDNDGLGDDGNATTFTYPCNFTQDNLVCVAALDQAYDLSSFSNYGATSVDVGAPGTNVLSSWAGKEITDDFSTGWTTNGGWTSGVCQGYDILTNPANWCTSSAGYAHNNPSARAYKSFNLNGAVAAQLDYYAQSETEPDFDDFSTNMRSTGGDPFVGGVQLQTRNGVVASLVSSSHDISACNTSTCSLGFELDSDALVNARGVGVILFKISTLDTNSTNYKAINGTSMASPHTAGLATMIRAFNPTYTYAQTVESIKNGGELASTLNGKSTTGRAINAMGSLSYITEPTGVTAVVQ